MIKEAALPYSAGRQDREANIKQAVAQVRMAASLGAQVVNKSDVACFVTI